MTSCRNCEFEFAGKFCPECSQKASTARLTFKDLFSEFWKKVLPWDKGFLYTTRKLLTQPAKMIRNYLEGRRVKYSKPLPYLLIISALSFLLMSRQEFENQLKLRGTDRVEIPTSTDPMQYKMTDSILPMVLNNGKFIMVFAVVFIALLSLLFYRRLRLNYAEHLVMNAYCMSGATFITLPFLLLTRLWRPLPLIGVVQSILFLSYFIWVYWKFFRPATVWSGLWKPVVALGGGFLMFMVLALVPVSVAIAIYLKWYMK